MNAGTGITPTIKSSNSTTVVVDLAVAANATQGNHAITVTVASQTSNSLNFFVQVPTYFVPFNANTALNTTCTPSDGFFAFVDYKVADQSQHAIPVSGLTPQESVSVNGGSFSSFASFSTPVSTKSDGTFEDIPIGSCFSAPPPPNRCVPVVQHF